jgi:hypothetical protein
MGFLNKSEVKKRLSLRELNGKRLYRPAGASDASGYLGQKPRRSASVHAIAKTPRRPASNETASTDSAVKSASIPISPAPTGAQA